MKEQQNTLKKMRNWKDEIILPADKRNPSHGSDREREDYDRKVRELLDNTYLPQTTKGPHTHSGR